uniref:Uncharacterized protein n=1 Tax=Anguilla anguilla TaxID=7936 RepID=A0A0E9Q381_ANGAN
MYISVNSRLKGLCSFQMIKLKCSFTVSLGCTPAMHSICLCSKPDLARKKIEHQRSNITNH